MMRRDKNNLGEHQEVKIYDLLTIDHMKDKFRGFAAASLKSSSSTALFPGECPLERETIQVNRYKFY